MCVVYRTISCKKMSGQIGFFALLIGLSMGNLQPISAENLSAGQSHICDVKDDKQAIVCYQSDDGLLESVKILTAHMTPVDIGLTVGLVTDWTDGNWPQTNDYVVHAYGSWQQWKQLRTSKKLGFSNHSSSHPCLKNVSQNELQHQVNGAQEKFTQHFNQKVLSYMFPFWYCHEQRELQMVQQNHYAARGQALGVNTIPPQNWYDLQSVWMDKNSTTQSLNQTIDEAIENNSFVLFSLHGTSGEGWDPVDSTVFAEHIAYAGEKSDSVWYPVLDEAVRYLYHRQAATVELIGITDSQIQLKVHSNVDDSALHTPLTIITGVAWQEQTLVRSSTADSVVVTPFAHKEHGWVVQYDCDGDTEITLEKQLPSSTQPIKAYRTPGLISPRHQVSHFQKFTLLGKRLSGNSPKACRVEVSVDTDLQGKSQLFLRALQ